MSQDNPPVIVVPPSDGNVNYASSSQPPRDSDYGPSKQSEIKLISHSLLFYWWPVPLLAFLMAFVTYVENSRLAVVPAGTRVLAIDDAGPTNTMTMEFPDVKKRGSFLVTNLTNYNPEQTLKDEPVFKARISGKSWPGGLFMTCLILTILVTNVPLRGLWSFLVIVMVIMFALIFALLDLWDKIFELMGNLHIHINMAGYITLGVITLTIWALAVFVFDRRTFVVFTPGQVKLCEHIGDAVQIYNADTIQLQKQRDDLFRHYIYGLGSGDLIIKVGGPDRREIRMSNIAFLGLRLNKIEDLLRVRATT